MSGGPLGVIARADDRGLGVLTLELVRHLKPDRVLVVDVPESPFPTVASRYPGATVARWSPGRPQFGPGILNRFLDGLDTVYSAETFYDSGLVARCRELGIRTVLHAMPEFYRPEWPRPTEVWAPTPWLLERLPAAELVPVPVPVPPFYVAAGHASRAPLRIVHVAGNRAAGDRNGTDVIRMALRRLQPDTRLELRVEVQRGVRPVLNGQPKGVRVTFARPRADRWDLYRDADLLLLPRRYGGLCLPVQEAMAVGLGVVMPDLPPNDWWPTIQFRADAPPSGGRLKAPCGELDLGAPDATALAYLLEALAAERGRVTDAQQNARQWAEDHSWPALLPEYERRLRP